MFADIKAREGDKYAKKNTAAGDEHGRWWKDIEADKHVAVLVLVMMIVAGGDYHCLMAWYHSFCHREHTSP